MKEISKLIINGVEYQLTPVPTSEMALMLEEMDEAKNYCDLVRNYVSARKIEIENMFNTISGFETQAHTSMLRAEEAAGRAYAIADAIGLVGRYNGEYEVIT